MINDSEQGTFYYNSLGALAKAVAFRSMAIHALNSGERVNATVSAYYSLLHLAFMLMYFFPDKIETTLLAKLKARRGSGETDPSSMIKHTDALAFIDECTKEGLDRNVYSRLMYAKRLREFVNYGPRVTIKKGMPRFGPCSDRPNDSNNLVQALDDLIPATLKWAYTNGALDGVLVLTALSQCSDFFKQRDLFYTQWCSRESNETALKFLEQLTV
jgi:hypothetical protein